MDGDSRYFLEMMQDGTGNLNQRFSFVQQGSWTRCLDLDGGILD